MFHLAFAMADRVLNSTSIFSLSTLSVCCLLIQSDCNNQTQKQKFLIEKEEYIDRSINQWVETDL